MKKNILFRIVLTMIIVIVTAACCKKDNPVSDSISPPEWIQGEWVWEWELVLEDEVLYSSFNYLFTSNDIILTSKSYTDENPVSLVFSDMANSNNLWIVKETIKTDEIYAVSLTGPAPIVYHFKKGDGTYIEVGNYMEGGTDKENLRRFDKK